jgi:outer membrane murein-binding lipoprotein Lpp
VLAVIKKAIGVDHPETENRQSLHQKYDTIYTLLREAKNRDEEVKDTQGEKLEAVTSNIDDLADNTVLGFEETVNKLNALTVELNNVKTLAKELKQKVADAKQELYLSIDGAKSLFRTQDSKTKGALSDMYLHLGEIDGRVIKLITKVSGTTTQVGALRTTVGATNIKVDQLRTEVFNLSNSVDVLKRDFLLFKEKLIEKIAETKKELQAQINELAAKTSNDKEEVLTKVDEAKKEFKDDIDELKTEVLQNRSLSDQRKEQLIARIDKVETD